MAENQKIFLLIGDSGSGKTSSMRNMPEPLSPINRNIF